MYLGNDIMNKILNKKAKFYVLTLFFVLFIPSLHLSATNATTYQLKDIGTTAMLQGFYWNVPAGGTWYNTVASKINTIANAGWGVGFDNVWLPPAEKATTSDNMGYEPVDYYDLGSYNQRGGVETRFGSQTELLNLINGLKTDGIRVTADIVLNHDGFGAWDPNAQGYYDFSNVSSGKFLRSAYDFHSPGWCQYASSDSGAFSDLPDLCLENPYDWQNIMTWGQWLRDTIGFTNWRLDYVKGYSPSVASDWLNPAYGPGGWGVGENWDGNVANIENWIASANYRPSAFDFPLYYTLQAMNDGNGYFDMSQLDHAGLAGVDPMHAVTFVANHDTDTISQGWAKGMAYAYILASEGYPSVFWHDYFDWGFNNVIDTVMNVRYYHAGGTTTTLYKDQDLYIMQRNGDATHNGLILMMNDGPSWSGQWVQTKFLSQTLYNFAFDGSSGFPVQNNANNEVTQSNGWVQLWAPPKGFSIWFT